MTTARFETVSTIINEALVELGLSSSASVDVFASTDALYVQARTLLKACGQELVAMPGREWQSLHKQHSFTAAAASAPAVYGAQALPVDIDHIVPGTAWNQTDDAALMMATPQQWEAIIVTASAGTVATWALIDADRILLYPPSAGDTVTFRYQSRYWLATTGTTTPALAAPAANTDVILFTPLLIKRLLKLRIAMAKKLPYAEELADFEASLAQESSKLAPAPVLNIGGGGSSFRLIDGFNLPETGFGS